MSDQTYPELQAPIILAEGLSFEDYLVQFEGKSTEWHMGKVVQKVSNNERHQLILGFLFRLLMDFIEIKQLGIAYMAGLPMFINDDVPAREPDILVVLNHKLDQIKSNHLEGPADIAIEIVSPGSGTDDRATKLFEYESAGVTEYWLIDPIRKEASIYVLNQDGKYERHPDDHLKRLQSTVLDGFVLQSMILWHEKLPTRQEINQLLDEMT